MLLCTTYSIHSYDARCSIELSTETVVLPQGKLSVFSINKLSLIKSNLKRCFGVDKNNLNGLD